MKNAVYRFRFPIAIAITCALALVDFKWHNGMLATSIICGARKETYAAVATILGALLGFEITAFSIVVTLTSTEVMKRLHRDGTAGTIFSGFVRATAVVGIGALVSLAAIFVDSDAHPRVWYEYVTLTLAIWSTLAIASTVFLIDEIVRAVLKWQADSPPAAN